LSGCAGSCYSHLAQVIAYLAITGCPVGLLPNFGARRLQWRRLPPSKNVTERQVNWQWLFVPDWLKESQLPTS